MRSVLFSVYVLTVGLTTFAAGKKQHHAHVHGGATLNIAFDELKGKINFKSASMGIVGFEHLATSKKDKKKLDDSLAQFESEIAQMIQFEITLGCQFTKDKIAMVTDDDSSGKNHAAVHADFVAEFSVICQKSIIDSKVVFNFSKFERLHDIEVVLLIGDLQKSVKLNKKPVTIEIK